MFFLSSLYIGSYLTLLAVAVIPEFNARGVTFSIMQCLHTIFGKFGFP